MAITTGDGPAYVATSGDGPAHLSGSGREEKLGFTREGKNRDAVFSSGSRQNVYWYGVLADEWDSYRTD